MPRRYLVVRTDRTAKSFILAELEQRRLRQGWGWLPEQDLRSVAAKLAAGTPLSKPEASAWRNHRLLPSTPGGVQPGDIIVLPNLPLQGTWVIARVTGGYRYDIPELEDYGHIVEVELVRDPTGKIAVVEADNAAVEAPLRATMRSMSRIWSIDHLGAQVEAVLAAIAGGKDTKSSEPAADKVTRVLEAARDAAGAEIERCYKAAELEHLVHPLLVRIYGERVQHRGGPSEQGADFLVYTEDVLGLEYIVGVQVKCFKETHHDTHALEQIKLARSAHRIDAGVVISAAREASAEFEQHRKMLERELGIDIKLILRDELVDLVLQHLRPSTTET